MDPQVERQGLTRERRVQAVLTARSIMKAYGARKAKARIVEMQHGFRDESEGNRQFYSLVEAFVKEAVEDGTIDGGPIA